MLTQIIMSFGSLLRTLFNPHFTDEMQFQRLFGPPKDKHKALDFAAFCDSFGKLSSTPIPKLLEEQVEVQRQDVESSDVIEMFSSCVQVPSADLPEDVETKTVPIADQSEIKVYVISSMEQVEVDFIREPQEIPTNEDQAPPSVETFSDSLNIAVADNLVDDGDSIALIARKLASESVIEAVSKLSDGLKEDTTSPNEVTEVCEDPGTSLEIVKRAELHHLVLGEASEEGYLMHLIEKGSFDLQVVEEVMLDN